MSAAKGLIAMLLRSSGTFSEAVQSSRLQIGFLVFPRITQLDLTGPVQVFSSQPDVDVHLIWKRLEPVPSDTVITLMPTITWQECPQLELSGINRRKRPTVVG